MSNHYRVKNNNVVKRKTDKAYVAKIVIAAFFTSSVVSVVSDAAFDFFDYFASAVAIILFIIIGIMFDIIGVAATAADEKPFHSMSAERVYASDIALSLIRNAEKVSNICNDVVGDIAGIVSGSAGAALAVKISESIEDYWLKTLIFMVIIGIIAAFTIGGKAVGKSYGINHSNTIIYNIAKIIAFFKRKKG